MASEKPEKKEKKDKKAKRSETDGVTKASKKEKKEKKEKKKLEKKLAEARDLDEKLQAAAAATVTEKAVLPAAADADDDSDVEGDSAAAVEQQVVPDLVPFAVPLADDKHGKKVLKCVRKSAKAKCLKRGVKEVVKALRKAPVAGPTNTSFPGVVVIAGDISPMDVISHLPVLCEDHNVPYIFIKSRAELGAAGSTKRPTSVVMVCEKRVSAPKKDKEKDKPDVEAEDVAAFEEAYKDLVKLVQKETLKQTRV